MKPTLWVIATLTSSRAVCILVSYQSPAVNVWEIAAKYSHAAVWPVFPGYAKSDASRGYPLAIMVANLAKPTPERPALMTHGDVVTFFHEMGHVFHGLLSRTKFARFHGTQCVSTPLLLMNNCSPIGSVARDFVEAPSQMLENWCWEPKVLKLMSSHYETKEPLSSDLIDKIIKRWVTLNCYLDKTNDMFSSRYANVGLFYLRQLFFARFDLKVHTDEGQSTIERYSWSYPTLRLL